MRPRFSRLNASPILLTALLFGLLALVPIQPVRAATLFISAPGRSDMVHDPARNPLYITSGNQVLRYSLGTLKFLSPIELGGRLAGIDLSPDGNTLAVADNTYSTLEAWIYIVNLPTGTSKKITLPLPPATFETWGTWSVAFTNNGDLLISSANQWGQLQKYNPTNGTVTTALDMIHGDPALSSSADRSVVGFTVGSVTSGSWGRYRVSDGNVAMSPNGTGNFNYEIATNRNGTQFAIPTFVAGFVYGSDLAQIAMLEFPVEKPHPIGAIYHPRKDLLYLSIDGTQEVHVYETNTFTQVGSINFGSVFQQVGARHRYDTGQLRMSRDGSLLFAVVDGGISFVSPLTVDIDNLIIAKERACALGWINQKTVCSSLDAKLNAAKDAIARIQFNTAKNDLNEFIAELDAQRGKAVNQQAYDQLKSAALDLIAQLP